MFLSVVSILMVLPGAGWLFVPETMLGWRRGLSACVE